MCWGMEPSTPPAKRSATKRLSSDYGKRLCRRLWDAYGLIASRKNLEENRIENPLGNAAEMWPASGRVLLGRSGRSSAGGRAFCETAQRARHHRARQAGAGRVKTH